VNAVRKLKKMARGKKNESGIVMVKSYEMTPFLTDIRVCMEELHTSIRMYEIELIEQGYTQEAAAEKARMECMKIKSEIVRGI
jgi:hypothetical protein